MVGWKEWSYKKRNQVLLGGAFLFLLIVYGLSIRNTVALYFENGDLQEKVNQARTAPQKIKLLEKKLAYWDHLANSAADSGNSIRQELFKRVGKTCDAHGAKLRSLEFSGSEQKENYMIDTYVVVMEGAYHKLLKAVNQLEDQLGNGVLSSVVFETETDRYTKRNYLRAKLYIQSVQ